MTAFASLPLRVASRFGSALVVGATLYVLDGSLAFAAGAAGGFLALGLAGDAAEALVGDYADNALFGAAVIAFAGYAAAVGTAWWLPAAVALVGGWLLLDGVQHLRHGETRDRITAPTTHEGNAAVGLVRALLDRLLAPVRLGV